MTLRIAMTILCASLMGACLDHQGGYTNENGSTGHSEQLLMRVDEPITETPRGYEIAMPESAVAEIPLDRTIALTVTTSEGRSSSVSGLAVVSSDTSVSLLTSERLEVPLDEPGHRASLAEPRHALACGSAEFGIDCFANSYLAFCAGTIYCLPGPGPGGFVCRCI